MTNPEPNIENADPADQTPILEAANKNPTTQDPAKKQSPRPDIDPEKDIGEDEDQPGEKRRTKGEGMDAGEMGERPDNDETEAEGTGETGEDEDEPDTNKTTH